VAEQERDRREVAGVLAQDPTTGPENWRPVRAALYNDIVGQALEVFTVGYEGRSLAAFVELLRASGVTRVIDVRELPLSRRRGFSKTPLSTALTKAGIEYVHVREAGNPFRAQKQDVDRCLRLYRGHLKNHPGVVERVRAALEGQRAALLCVEADSCRCHRSVIVDQLRAHTNVRVREL